MQNASLFRRETHLARLAETPEWDVLIIGGGATGLGVAVDAASRGYRTLLLERADFAQGTSSRSTKLAHGGVRYLAQGNVGLVREALRERGRMLRNAPHLVRRQAFVIPCYRWWERGWYLLGLKLYDMLAGRFGIGGSRALSAAKTLRHLPGLQPAGLRGGVLYYDGQFDDARLALALARTAADQGATVLNYITLTALRKDAAGRITGATARDEETGQPYELRAKVVVNATGVFVDEVLCLDQPAAAPLVRPSQGVHVVLPRTFLPGPEALMIPRTPDGRVLFAVPWQGRVVVGTTDTLVAQAAAEPRALPAEIDFILDSAGRYLARPPQRADVLSTWAGLRPLAAPSTAGAATKEISRSHKLLVAASGLLTITGGKWTTYRQMAEDVVDRASQLGPLPARPCRTAELPLHGAPAAGATPATNDPLAAYGTDAPALRQLLQENPAWAAPLAPGFPFLQAEVVWAARHEMARTVADVLARRLRLLFLDAAAAQAAAPVVAALLAAELGQDEAWQQQQLAEFRALTAGYLLP
ncbi:glycerol-3-phosphate dehydrogenase [Hymenobacter daecheongensis DSM 21074]|uniref:Glycerol-3-phosphate dehydrogenase n=1 Tax=Hymenobacter daecheongensis DSM 21074 TaxID=1121955 RepID=A0A1M6JMG1_9BACT|nr:glycerol-3-phosphate dehydrogenase/oxidase [Hymenobacter daecheongensis]SHJ47897.1 glycerol-3-phosphate dehydrogenase [Hymenobacter daecheongensis DSM 21074]